ncbi:MAG: hypothetical protein ACK2VA_19965, partial [Anaerolineae bacterium]
DREIDTVTASGVDDEGTPVEDSDDAIVDVVSASVQIVKTRLTESPVLVGDIVEFQIVVTNIGEVPLESVTVQDTYDNDYLFYGSVQAAAERQITWSNLGPLAPGESVTIPVEFTALASTQALEGKETVNTATVTAADESGNQHVDTDSDTVGIYAPGISIVKTASEPIVPLDEPFTYTILITNVGDYDLNPVAVTDMLPNGMIYVAGSAVPAPTTVAGQQLVWADLTNGAPLAPGEHVQITLQVYVSGGAGTYENVATVDATHPRGLVTDTGPGPVLADSPRLAIDKKVAPPGNAVKGVISFTIEIRNIGSTTIDVLPLTDEWTGPTTYIGGAPIPNAIDNVAHLLQWDDLTAPAPYGFGSNLAPGEAFIITVRYQLNAYMETFSMVNTAIVDGARDIYGTPVERVEDEVAVHNVPTPIEIMGFRASLDSAGVLVQWETFREDRNTLGFALLRSTTGDLVDAQQVGFVAATGLGTGVTSYSFVDQEVQPGTTYSYWLRVDYMAPELHSETYKNMASVTMPYRFYLPIVSRGAD